MTRAEWYPGTEEEEEDANRRALRIEELDDLDWRLHGLAVAAVEELEDAPPELRAAVGPSD